MENLLVNGDYVPNGFGGFTRLQGQEAVLQRVLFRLNCRRGSFPFLPGLGSRVHSLLSEKPGQRALAARQYCTEALRGMGVSVESVELKDAGDDKMDMTVRLKWQEETMAAEVTV